MPYSAPAGCLALRCPNAAVFRGRCGVHRLTTSGRGYGREHQLERQAALPGARCSTCGCRNDLQRSHTIPGSMGGAARDWLCDCPLHRCHSRLGMKSTSRPSRVFA